MLKYKLTTQDNKTYNNTLWGENVTHKTNGEGELCSSGWLHYYHSPLLAALLNSPYGNIKNYKLWECHAEGKHLDDHGIKGGCTKLTTIKEIILPKVSFEQRIRFGILCAKQVYKEEKWNLWADRWLSGEDRTRKSAYAAYTAYNYDRDITPVVIAAAAHAAAAVVYTWHAHVANVNAVIYADAAATAVVYAAVRAANVVTFDIQSIAKQSFI